jgi:hypothetical protein
VGQKLTGGLSALVARGNQKYDASIVRKIKRRTQLRIVLSVIINYG